MYTVKNVHLGGHVLSQEGAPKHISSIEILRNTGISQLSVGRVKNDHFRATYRFQKQTTCLFDSNVFSGSAAT